MYLSIAPTEWLDDLVLDLTEREVLLDLDPAQLIWEPASAGPSPDRR